MRHGWLVCVLLSGCAYTTSTTAVAPMGQDTYSVGASAGEYAGGSAEARTLALQKANGHCQSLSRQLKVLAVEPAGERTNVTFQCLMPGDPRLAQPSSGPTINVNLNQGR